MTNPLMHMASAAGYAGQAADHLRSAAAGRVLDPAYVRQRIYACRQQLEHAERTLVEKEAAHDGNR